MLHNFCFPVTPKKSTWTSEEVHMVRYTGIQTSHPNWHTGTKGMAVTVGGSLGKQLSGKKTGPRELLRLRRSTETLFSASFSPGIPVHLQNSRLGRRCMSCCWTKPPSSQKSLKWSTYTVSLRYLFLHNFYFKLHSRILGSCHFILENSNDGTFCGSRGSGQRATAVCK